MAVDQPDPTILYLDWALAALATLLWGTAYGVALWREPAFRRWLDLRLARWARGAPRLAPPGRVRRPVPPRPSPRPVLRSGPPARIAGNTALAPPAPRPEREAVRIAEWTVRHLPLRYRLLGRPRPPVNDN